MFRLEEALLISTGKMQTTEGKKNKQSTDTLIKICNVLALIQRRISIYFVPSNTFKYAEILSFRIS